MDDTAEFQIECSSSEPDLLLIRIIGELDVDTADRVLDAVTSAEPPASNCTVDLSDCTFLDSSGIRALLLAQRQLDGGSGNLRVRGASPRIQRVLRIAGVDEVLEIEADEDRSVDDSADGA